MGQLQEIQQLAANLATVVVPSNLTPIHRIYTVPSLSPATTMDTPCLIIFNRRPNKIEMGTFGKEWRTTQYIVQFVYTMVGQGTLEDSWTAVIQYQEPILDVLWANSNQFNGVENVQWAVPVQESMPMQLLEKWGGQAYFGIDFSVTVSSARVVALDRD